MIVPYSGQSGNDCPELPQSTPTLTVAIPAAQLLLAGNSEASCSAKVRGASVASSCAAFLKADDKVTVAAHCNTLQHTTINGNTRQHTMTHCSIRKHTKNHMQRLSLSLSVFCSLPLSLWVYV